MKFTHLKQKIFITTAQSYNNIRFSVICREYTELRNLRLGTKKYAYKVHTVGVYA